MFSSYFTFICPLYFMLCHMPYDTRHKKTDLKVFVVIPKEGWACVWYVSTFQNFSLLTSQIVFSESRCHTKRRMAVATRAHPSFGMTTTKDLKVFFSRRASYFLIMSSYICISILTPSVYTVHELHASKRCLSLSDISKKRSQLKFDIFKLAFWAWFYLIPKGQR